MDNQSKPDTHREPDSEPPPLEGPLLLTDGPPESEADAHQLQPEGSAVKFDDLGPMVVNSDGTLSRISNWSNMTEPEKERTLRVLSARNKIRLANEQQKLTDTTGAQQSS
ncbi:hypothetical protein B0H11DRAFT_1214284 [Mycena galericulata]|nr:hypothetical protein B0H11DRAFT_1214284 [Mycena galericulata]